ncbi:MULTISPECIES: hypothetical protein [Pseudoalteromonas]|uniref:hypothetical protein n=1 Tax=Pseudoalteromonas TaxID=53246 RepID=UPI00078581A5|nr:MULTISPECIES: hypothetical protein [Pseudoalteromonas]MCF7517708.1 hypothetical protein [Pseudoalteromonas sp. L21]UJX27411.1 hypothetical protein L3Q70_19365 [Pseudoalteromonas sp. CF6-2]|tara:strand:- start:6408 stop:6800 length:393 start_codon:yes stop_codon:yes gene_type:complete
MKCPEDGQPLKADEAEAHTGYGCASCKGAWLPKSYVQSIKFTKEFDPKDFFSALSISKSQTSNNQCPMNCGALRSTNNLSYCPSCLGVWFKHKALRKMLNNYQTKRDNANSADTPIMAEGIFSLLGALFK